MTVAELIEHLQSLPGDSRVVITLPSVNGDGGVIDVVYSEVSSIEDGYSLTPTSRGVLWCPTTNADPVVPCVLIS